MSTTFAPNTPFSGFNTTPGVSPWQNAFSNTPFNTPWAQIPGVNAPSIPTNGPIGSPINNVPIDPAINNTWQNFGQPSTPFFGSPIGWNPPFASTFNNSFYGPQNFSQIPSWSNTPSYSPVNTTPFFNTANTPFNSFGVCPFNTTPAYTNTFQNSFNPFFNPQFNQSPSLGFNNTFQNTINPFFNNTPSFPTNTFGNSFNNNGFGFSPSGVVNSFGYQGFSPINAYGNTPWNTPWNNTPWNTPFNGYAQNGFNQFGTNQNGFNQNGFNQPYANGFNAVPFFNTANTPFNTPYNTAPFYGPFNAPQGYGWSNGNVPNQPVSVNGVNTPNAQQGLNINRDAA